MLVQPSTAARDASHNGCLVVESGQVSIHNGGGASGDFGAGTDCGAGFVATSPTFVSTPLENPLSFLDALEPSTAGAAKSGCGQGPGVYNSVPTGCDLLPGLYVITGGTHISGHDEIRAPGVTLFFTCPGGCVPGQTGAELTCTGDARMSITAPTTSPGPGVPPGLAIWFDQYNEGSLDCRGNGAGLYSGTIYGRSATIWNRGTGLCTGFDSLVVVGQVKFSGNPSSCTISYHTSANVQIPYGDTHLVE